MRTDFVLCQQRKLEVPAPRKRMVLPYPLHLLTRVPPVRTAESDSGGEFLRNFRFRGHHFRFQKQLSAQHDTLSADRMPPTDRKTSTVGALYTKAAMSRRDGAAVMEMFGACDNIPGVNADFRLNHKPRKRTKEDNELRKRFAEACLRVSIDAVIDAV